MCRVVFDVVAAVDAANRFAIGHSCLVLIV